MTSPDHNLIEQNCARLVALYANLTDAGEWHALADLFCEDGRMSRPSAPDVWIEGRAQILAAFESRPARLARHLCTNVVISAFSATEAKGTCALALFQPGEPVKIGGFDDCFVLGKSGWQFSERRGTLLF